MPIPASADRPGVASALGSLALSVVRPRSATTALRARTWLRDLQRMGIELPFALVHDVGLLLSTPPGELVLGPRCDVQALLGKTAGAEVAPRYRELLLEIADSEPCRETAAARLGDPLVSTVLARLLGRVASKVPQRPDEIPELVPADPEALALGSLELAALWARVDRRVDLAAAAALVEDRLLVLTLLDTLDQDTLRLTNALGGDDAHRVELLSALDDPGSREVTRFSLELLPSVLETRARPAAASHAAHGYAGVGRRGSIDGLVLSELAWDDEELVRRLLDDEVLYYARDQARTELSRSHVLLIDASASMRGDRATFARALALATAKKLSLLGEEVSLRFFDARLYEPIPTRGRELPVAALLGFHGERGRNPTRVFGALAAELGARRDRDRTHAIVHVFTHGANDIPRAVLSQLASVAEVTAVFVAPRGEIDLGYLDLLRAHWTVSEEGIAVSRARADAARAILRDQGSAPSRRTG